jgi:hypothetical protein
MKALADWIISGCVLSLQMARFIINADQPFSFSLPKEIFLSSFNYWQKQPLSMIGIGWSVMAITRDSKIW